MLISLALTPFKLAVEDLNMHSVNVSWSQESSALTTLSSQFNLTISHGSQSRIIPLNDPHYHFSPSKNASPCDVYNFSVTATYDIVGATYTGDGCSVPSPVLSMMLPSLPDVSNLESSLNYSLVMESSGGVMLRVIFMVSC